MQNENAGTLTLPRALPQSAAYELAVTWQPARAVGGDFYDAWQLDEHRLAICLGDVMGKGMPAALLMAHLQAAIHAHATAQLEPAALCATLNQLICDATQGARFITFFCAVYDARAGLLRYTNAGHNAPLWLTRDGDVRTLATGGLPLGAFAERGYEQGSVRLQRGDRLLLFTDGLTECCDETGREFGETRLQELMRSLRDTNAQTLCDDVAQAVQSFNGGAFQDDATWLAFTLR